LARRVTWTDSAWQEPECAAGFIARDSGRYAAAVTEEALAAARSLRKFPRRGRIVPEAENEAIRELFIRSYRLIYEIRGDGAIVIPAFIHGARRFPAALF